MRLLTGGGTASPWFRPPWEWSLAFPSRDRLCYDSGEREYRFRFDA